MRCRALRSTWFVSFYQTASNHSTENNLQKRCLDQLRKNILPTIFILVCSSMFSLYVSELIYRAKLHPTEVSGQPLSAAIPENSGLMSQEAGDS